MFSVAMTFIRWMNAAYITPGGLMMSSQAPSLRARIVKVGDEDVARYTWTRSYPCLRASASTAYHSCAIGVSSDELSNGSCDAGNRRGTLPPNAPRLSCAARASGRDDRIDGAHQYVGAQLEFCQDRGGAASTASYAANVSAGDAVA